MRAGGNEDIEGGVGNFLDAIRWGGGALLVKTRQGCREDRSSVFLYLSTVTLSKSTLYVHIVSVINTILFIVLPSLCLIIYQYSNFPLKLKP